MKIYKIVLTGGPCAGKTTVIDVIRNYLEHKGFCVITVSETATEMINSGITPHNVGQIAFQQNLLRLQLQKETVFSCCAESYSKNVVMILDRGALDGKAYLEEHEYSQILNELNLNESTLYDSYDAVLFLDSAAADGVDYTTSNNSARSESAEEAVLINKKTFSAWVEHKNLYIIKNELIFEDKITKTLDIINNIIAEMY